MKNLTIDLSILPNNAQQELYDFYQFLVHKYTSKWPTENINRAEIVPRQVNPFEPLKRESIYEQ